MSGRIDVFKDMSKEELEALAEMFRDVEKAERRSKNNPYTDLISGKKKFNIS